MLKRARRPHGIRSRKISISISEEDLRLLGARAHRLYRDNLSAVIHELAESLRRREALEKILSTWGRSHHSEVELDAIRDEMQAAPARGGLRPRRRRAA
jgi:hypothetical protein